MAGLVLLAPVAMAPAALAQAPAAITVEAESAAQTNIPTAADAEASGGKYLALNTGDDPGPGGWYATYEVDVPARGVYRLDAAVTSPARDVSYFNVSINRGRFTQVAKSNSYWGEFPTAWGDLARVHVDDVELRRGRNTITFMVNERRIRPAPQNYVFSLDELSLTPTPLALADVYIRDPTSNLGVYGAGERPRLRFRLNGHSTRDMTVSYTVTDYFSHEVASGTAQVEAGARAGTVALPDLPPGNYRAEARLRSSPARSVVGNFARLPDQRPAAGPANRFAVMAEALELLGSSQLGPFASAMKRMGVGYVREELLWPVIEQERGSYDTHAFDRIAAAFHDHGIKTLEFWGSDPGRQAPDWARSETSGVLPADLRDAYNFTNHLARQTDGVGSDALEVWNEPEQEAFCCSTGDQQAAYVKAAALGIDATPDRPLVALPGVFTEGALQDLMLQGGVARYADIWSFHTYPAQLPNPGGLTPFPPQSGIQHDLKRLYGAPTQMWATEAGLFSPATPGEDLTPPAQIDQARYLVQSTVQDLAAGTDKHFWFIGPPCCTAFGIYFALLSRDLQPLPAYSAHAAMASILGKADFVRELPHLPSNAAGYQFRNGDQAVSVVWADSPTPVSVPVPGATVTTYDVMGARRGAARIAGGSIDVTASLDPIYVVSNGGRRLPALSGDHEKRRPNEFSDADRVVLSQQFAAEDAAPEKDAGEPPPFGYALDTSTEMSVDVYNFNDRTTRVTVAGRAWAGWSVSGPRTALVPPHGRVAVPFTIVAGSEVRRQVDYPLAFEARVGGRDVPPSVSRIQLRGGEPGEPVELAPLIEDISPGDGAAVPGPIIELRARVTDSVSGVDPEQVVVEVDGRRVESRYGVASGRLSASLPLAPGRHEIRIRAGNNAHAPAQATMNVRVLP